MCVRVLQSFVAWFDDSFTFQISGTVFIAYFPVLSLFWCGRFLPRYGTDAACHPVENTADSLVYPFCLDSPMYRENGYVLTVTFSFYFSASR